LFFDIPVVAFETEGWGFWERQRPQADTQRYKVDFQVFNKSELATDFSLNGAYMFGTDGIAVQKAQIAFNNGIISCRKANLETAGLALLWPVEGFGKILLPTTCLPERAQPHILNVEIARAKLMNIINKREEWSLFGSIERLEPIFKEARSLFIQAIQNIADAPLASRLADESLKKSIVLAEKLAMRQADSLLKAQIKGRGFGRRCFGCKIDPRQITNPAYIENLLQLFGFVTVPIRWSRMEPQRGVLNFSVIDKCISALAKKRLAICLGPLLLFTKDAIPNWLLDGRATFEQVRDAAYRFILKIVSRYAGSVHAWRVVSGLNMFNYFGFGFEQVLEMTRVATMAVKAASSRSVKIVEVTNPWGEYYAALPHSIPPLVYMDMVVQSGINFDAFGLQMHFGKNQPGMHIRDMLQVSAVLDYFGGVAKPLYITGVEVPSAHGHGPRDAQVAGVWHKPWSQVQQAQWIEQFFRIALSKPFVDTVTYSNLADITDSTIVDSGLFTSRLEPKVSFQTLKKLHEEICSR